MLCQSRLDLERGNVEFVRVAHSQEVPLGTMKTVDVGGEPVLVANVDSQYYAIGAICKHAEWDLSEGTLDGTTVICAGHGAIWDIRTGQAEFPMPLEPEPVYEVRVVDGEIYIKPRANADAPERSR